MKDFLQSAEEQLKLNKDKESVMTELSDHVETKIEFFESIGYDKEASTEKANEAMGNGEVVGQRLHQIHYRKQISVLFPILSVIFVNIFLNFGPSTDENSFFLPFVTTLFILIYNFLGTALAIKRKMKGLSITLIAVACTVMWITMAELAYPLCNLIISRVHFTENFYTAYYFFRFLITAVIVAMIVLPNAYNIYHCRQMRQLKNTKKQNIFAGKLRNFCFIAVVFCIIASFPYYTMNDRLCEEQAKVRDELIDFVFETQSKFNYDEIDELCAYLENCEYDFERWTRYMEDVEDISDTAYIYEKGNWELIIWFENDSIDEGYSADLRSIIKNCSEKYICTTREKENALIEILGDTRNFDDEELDCLPNSSIGVSAEDIKSSMDGFNITSFSIDKYAKYVHCNYYWIKVDELYLYNTYDSFYGNGYQFRFDEENKCSWYSLSTFEKHEPVNWEDYT